MVTTCTWCGLYEEMVGTWQRFEFELPDDHNYARITAVLVAITTKIGSRRRLRRPDHVLG